MIHHLQYISTGKHTAHQPRGLATCFGPGGGGWDEVRDLLCPMLEARSREAGRGVGVVWWLPWGVEPADPTRAKEDFRSRDWISDRGCERARAGLPPEWAARACDLPRMAGCLTACRLAGNNGEQTLYVGAVEMDQPEEAVERLARVRAVQRVVYDATAHMPFEAVRGQWARIEALGCGVGFEAVCKAGRRELYQTNRYTLCSTIGDRDLRRGWVEEMFKVSPWPMDDRRSPPEMAIACRVLLIDPMDHADKAAELAQTYDVAVNLLSKAWRDRPIAA